MNEQNITQRTQGAALTDDELASVVGGGSDPVDPTPSSRGIVDSGSKSTPILM